MAKRMSFAGSGLHAIMIFSRCRRVALGFALGLGQRCARLRLRRRGVWARRSKRAITRSRGDNNQLTRIRDRYNASFWVVRRPALAGW
jgi:hypothetical protein